jgi:DNA-binding transcriptional regulator YdaS (Cro superfamily)
MSDGLKRAIEAAGGQKRLAKRINVTQSQVWYWLMRSKKGVPAERVLDIERETGVSRTELRPDIWPEARA